MRDATRLVAATICCAAGVAFAQNPCGDLKQADTPAKKKACEESICKQAAQK